MHNVIQLFLDANTILLMRKWNHAFLLLVIVLVWKKQIASLSEDNIFLKKQTRWSNDKTNYYWTQLSQNIGIRQCLADQLFTEKSWYFDQPHPNNC